MEIDHLLPILPLYERRTTTDPPIGANPLSSSVWQTAEITIPGAQEQNIPTTVWLWATQTCMVGEVFQKNKILKTNKHFKISMDI